MMNIWPWDTKRLVAWTMFSVHVILIIKFIHISCGSYPLYTKKLSSYWTQSHDDVIKWKHFSRYWPFVRGIHRSLVKSPHKCLWGGALMFSLICVWINGCVNNREAGDLRRYRAHHDVIVMAFLENLMAAAIVARHLKNIGNVAQENRYAWGTLAND